MLYIKNIPGQQSVWIPCNGILPDPAGVTGFRLRSTTDLTEYATFAVLALTPGVIPILFKVFIDLSLIPIEGHQKGEYEYTLYNIPVGATEEIIISSGLAVIGGYTKPSEYNKEITYEQYETEQ